MKKIILINWVGGIKDFNYIKDLDSVYINWSLYLSYNNLKEFNYNKPINWGLYLYNNYLKEFNYNHPTNWSLYLGNNNLTEFNYNKPINWFLDLENNNLNITKQDLKCKVKKHIYL